LSCACAASTMMAGEKRRKPKAIHCSKSFPSPGGRPRRWLAACSRRTRSRNKGLRAIGPVLSTIVPLPAIVRAAGAPDCAFLAKSEVNWSARRLSRGSAFYGEVGGRMPGCASAV
jgi:hypothetical protein